MRHPGGHETGLMPIPISDNDIVGLHVLNIYGPKRLRYEEQSAVLWNCGLIRDPMPFDIGHCRCLPGANSNPKLPTQILRRAKVSQILLQQRTMAEDCGRVPVRPNKQRLPSSGYRPNRRSWRIETMQRNTGWPETKESLSSDSALLRRDSHQPLYPWRTIHDAVKHDNDRVSLQIEWPHMGLI